MPQYKFLTSTCKGATGDTIAGCMTSETPLQVYNFRDQLLGLATNTTACGTAEATQAWVRNVSSDYINCCDANKFDANFFRSLFSSKPKRIETLDEYQLYRGNEDENVLSASIGLEAAGTTQKFQLSQISHSANGKENSLFEGMWLYNYRNRQKIQITGINKSTVNAHLITVRSIDGTTNVDIAKGDKFLRIPAVMVGGSSCPVGTSTMNSNYTTKRTNRLRMRTKWCMNVDVDKPYADHLLFAPFVDKTGQVSYRALPILKSRAMSEITQAENLALFLGLNITNPAIDVDGWTGGEGLVDSIRGAGGEWDYDPAVGFSFLDDFEGLFLSMDGKKSTTEWLMLGNLRFQANMTRRFMADAKNAITPLDFGTLQRYAADQESIKQHTVTSFEYLGRKIMFKEFKQLSVSNGIGNGELADTAFIIGMNGNVNNRGEELPPVQFYRSESSRFGAWEDMIENDRQNFLINGCETLEGDIIKTVIWNVHCPDNHRVLTPSYCS